jgi:hypothetical protein
MLFLLLSYDLPLVLKGLHDDLILMLFIIVDDAAVEPQKLLLSTICVTTTDAPSRRIREEYIKETHDIDLSPLGVNLREPNVGVLSVQ